MSHDLAVRFLGVRASIATVDFDDLGGVVTMARLDHSDPVYGYRLEHAGQSIVNATDTEHLACVDPTFAGTVAAHESMVLSARDAQKWSGPDSLGPAGQKAAAA